VIVSVLGAIIYFVNPLDLIPDFIFLFGYLDDAAIIAFVINMIQNDIKKFIYWEKGHLKNSDNITN